MRPDHSVPGCTCTLCTHTTHTPAATITTAESRRLRTEYPERTLGHWDATTGRAVLVHGPGAPGAEPWEA